MENRQRLLSAPLALALAAALVVTVQAVSRAKASGTFLPVTVADQTSTQPLASPIPSSYQPRYVSGFGQDDSFTVFFEDRDAGGTISYASTTAGPTGLDAAATPTNIADTHFVVKDWPVTIDDTAYAYRAWGAVGNNPQHHFYVSNDLTSWTLVSTFTVTNAAEFTNAKGWVYYGFHDVVKLNGTYYAFAESNQSQTMVVSSTTGTDDWVAFASVGGTSGDGPLELPSGVSYGWTPSGSFFELGEDRGCGKIYVDPRDSAFYLAINTAAKPSLAPAELEAAFIDPANWTWHDGTTGPAASPILSATAEHDLRECWLVPSSDPGAGWTLIYDADFGSGDGGKALGYALLQPPPSSVYVDDDWQGQTDVDLFDPSLTWQRDAFSAIQDGIDAVASGGTVHVAAGTYPEQLQVAKPLNLAGAGSDATVIDAGGSGNGVIISADSVTMSGFQVRNAGSGKGIQLKNNSGCTIEDNLVDGCGYPIHLSSSSSNLISANTLINGSNASAIWATGSSHDNTISGNTMSDNLGGIWVYGGDGWQIYDNVLENGSAGISGMFGCDDWVIARNHLSGWANAIDTSYGSATNWTITENHIHDNEDGIQIDAGSGNEAHFNSIHGNEQSGITVDSGSMDAANNWWGCNAGPGNPGCDAAAGAVDAHPWLVLHLTANPVTTSANGGTSVLTATLKKNSDGEDTSSSGHVPNGITTAFTATLGSVAPVVTGTLAGTARATFTAGATQGTAVISATVDAQTVTVTLTIGPAPAPPMHYVYLPVIQSNHQVAPDLVVQSVTAGSDGVEVVIENQGDAPVVDPFWVDVYIDPDPAPTHVNQVWQQLCQHGLVWGITEDALPALRSGGTLTLTVGGSYYSSALSHAIWPLAPGTPVYAQVDSANTETSYGAVLESHEIAGGPYNNTSERVLSTAEPTRQPDPDEPASPSPLDLPLRLPPLSE